MVYSRPLTHSGSILLKNWKPLECLSPNYLDPCLFIEEKVICIYYVDDLLFWSKDEAHINELAILLHHSGVDLEQEDDAASFLGAK